jgi:hypothetical protein
MPDRATLWARLAFALITRLCVLRPIPAQPNLVKLTLGDAKGFASLGRLPPPRRGNAVLFDNLKSRRPVYYSYKFSALWLYDLYYL